MIAEGTDFLGKFNERLDAAVPVRLASLPDKREVSFQDPFSAGAEPYDMFSFSLSLS